MSNLNNASEAPTTHRIPGLGFVVDEDNGKVTLQFVDEAAATKFMQDYAPSVDIDAMPQDAARTQGASHE